MTTFINVIHCYTHGSVQLTEQNYHDQMNNEHSEWLCPVEGCDQEYVQWEGQWYICDECGEEIEVGDNVCPECGVDHYEKYLQSQIDQNDLEILQKTVIDEEIFEYDEDQFPGLAAMLKRRKK